MNDLSYPFLKFKNKRNLGSARLNKLNRKELRHRRPAAWTVDGAEIDRMRKNAILIILEVKGDPVADTDAKKRSRAGGGISVKIFLKFHAVA